MNKRMSSFHNVDIVKYISSEMNTTKDLIDANKNRIYYNKNKLRKRCINYSKRL